MKTHPILRCGCAANAERVMPDGTRRPSCAAHAGLVEPNDPLPEQPDFSQRKARCTYDHPKNPRGHRDSTTASDGHETTWGPHGLPFFRSRPDQEFDEYYCGCHGWE